MAKFLRDVKGLAFEIGQIDPNFRLLFGFGKSAKAAPKDVAFAMVIGC
ncbi:hypothetical protein [Shimia sp.]|jgi:hypothetical protein|nr:hypothetical protein [Shimia sp.]MCH2066895.1 hypothetical protein [Shimia sp.]